MLMPGQTYDAAGRVKFTSSGAPAAPTGINSGFGCDANGRILANTGAPPASAARNGAMAFDSSGCVYVATVTAGTDIFVNGYRLTVDGALVVAQEGTIAYFNGAQGFDTNGALVTTEL